MATFLAAHDPDTKAVVSGDEETSGRLDLFDVDWAWDAYCGVFGRQEQEPLNVRVLEATQVPGRRARATYEIEWPEDVYIPNQQFTVQRDEGQRAQVFRFPDDPELPGLAQVCDPEAAMGLIKKHVMTIPPRRIRAEVIRYRPGSHAVLRHRLGKARFYARAMKPAAMPVLLDAAELVARSQFGVPRIAGYWREGAVVWTSEIPGENLRQNIRAGKQPDPGTLLDGLQSLWAIPVETCPRHPFGLAGRYRGAKREIRPAVLEHDDARRAYRSAVKALDPFIESWRPTSLAHNDFYDDQLLVLPDGHMVLVDFEETGPGDPLLDVGNFLAHLGWSSTTGSAERAAAKEAYRKTFRDAALGRFGWDEHELALREAVCLFRMCVFPVIRPDPDWLAKLERGLTLVNETLA